MEKKANYDKLYKLMSRSPFESISESLASGKVQQTTIASFLVSLKVYCQEIDDLISEMNDTLLDSSEELTKIHIDMSINLLKMEAIRAEELYQVLKNFQDIDHLLKRS